MEIGKVNKNNYLDTKEIGKTIKKQEKEFIIIILTGKNMMVNGKKVKEMEMEQCNLIFNKIRIYSYGDKYVGEFKNGMKSGYGILYY